tara:strand:- start:7466 stop:8269 length:804 start_codon:yes stop_codon:yes gene_type:complete
MTYYTSDTFTSHTMYDQNGTAYTASTYALHQQYMALGYTHYNPLTAYTTYSTDYPTHIGPQSYDLTSIHQTQLSTTQSMHRHVSDKGGQRFGIKFNYSPLTRDQFLPIWTFLITQKGRFGRFTLALPNSEPRGSLRVASGQTHIQVKTTVNNGNTVTLKNFHPSSSKVIKQGDYFRFGTQGKTYIATQDYDSNASGEVVLTIYPNLTASVAGNTQVYFEPVFFVSLVNDNLDVNVPSNNNANFSVEFIETIYSSNNEQVYTTTAEVL